MPRTRSLPLLTRIVALAPAVGLWACDPVPTRATGWQPPTAQTFGSAPPAQAAIDAMADDTPQDEDTDTSEPSTLSDAEAAIVDAYAWMDDAEEEPAADEADVASPTMTASDDPSTSALAGRAAVDAGAPSAFAPRILSIVPGTQPPRAILSLADGREVVVEPGSMLPEDGLIVLAIGTDAVQLATLSPMGDRAAVSTQLLQPLYRTAAPSLAPPAPPLPAATP